MTLRQAFKMWSMAPRNMDLAKKSKDAVEKVLMKKYSDIDLENITAGFVQRLFERCRENQQMKTKAASILVYLLQWGGDHGYCKRPCFDYTIAHTPQAEPSFDAKPGTDDSYEEYFNDEPLVRAKPLYEIAGQEKYKEEPIVKVKPEALERRKKELEMKKGLADGLPIFDIDNDKKEIKVMNKTSKRKVVQIDMNTLQPIKTWNSVSDATRALGVKNVARAIQRKGAAGGYYWCNIGEEGDFKPNKASAKQVVAERMKKEKKAISEPKNNISVPKPIGMSPDFSTVYVNDITKCTDDELIAEIQRRGWKGTLEIIKKVTL